MLAELPEITPRPLTFRQAAGRRLRVNVVSDPARAGHAHHGGLTGFLDCAALMATHPDIEVRVNARESCDVVHSHGWGPGGWLVGRGLPRVMTAHGLPDSASEGVPLGRVGAPMVRRYLRALYDRSDVVIATAPAANAAITALGTRSAVRTVVNPVRLERFHPSAVLRARGRRRLGLAPTERTVLGVGPIQPSSGIADFVATAEAVPDVTFLWVGARPSRVGAAGRGSLNRLISNPPRNVRFIGAIDHLHMPEAHNAADAMVFPTFQATCPHAPMEAAACGVPVIYRDLSAYEDIYHRPYLAGDGPDQFAGHVRALLSRHEWHDQWSAQSMALARDFSTEAYVSAVADLYDALVCELPLPA